VAAYNYTQPPDATGQQLTSHGPNAKVDVFPNFNGQDSIPYNGNFVITATDGVTQGALWTAHYGIAGPDTITIQFAAPLLTASTTAADYTLSGPSAPSISSVAFNAGSRNIQLNLSGSLVATNTYTLKIAPNKVSTGTKIAYRVPKWGIYNWPNLVVDVIQPTVIACDGVGIQQVVALGDPSMNTTNAAQSVGFQQDITLGTPVANTLISNTGVGVQQDAVLGAPTLHLGVNSTVVGIDQQVPVGSPLIDRQLQPGGVGIQQDVSFGSPDAVLNPIMTDGVGIVENVLVGIPISGGPIDSISVGIPQLVESGTPIVTRLNDRIVTDVGFDQPIDLGIPVMANVNTQRPHMLGFDQPTDAGTPSLTKQELVVGVGIGQTVILGAPAAAFTAAPAHAVGIQQDVVLGAPAVVAASPPLQVTSAQAAALADLDTLLHQAFADGVQGPVDPALIAKIDGYIDHFNLLQQYQTRLIFEELAAATMVALDIPGVLPNTTPTETVPLANITPTPGGATGSMTFVDGILTSKVEPT
jgi:hypothetical protein